MYECKVITIVITVLLMINSVCYNNYILTKGFSTEKILWDFSVLEKEGIK